MLAAQIDSIFSAIEEYEKKNLGIKYGDEFPEIARALIDSTKFKDIVKGVSIIGLLTALTITKGEAKDFIEDSPMRVPLAGLFYAGYKLGLETAEIKSLEKLHNKETK